MKWWEKMLIPLRRVWIRLASRFRSRKTGLLILRRDVMACECEDVRILWEMLKKNEGANNAKKKIATSSSSSSWDPFAWAKFTACLGRAY